MCPASSKQAHVPETLEEEIRREAERARPARLGCVRWSLFDRVVAYLPCCANWSVCVPDMPAVLEASRRPQEDSLMAATQGTRQTRSRAALWLAKAQPGFCSLAC